MGSLSSSAKAPAPQQQIVYVPAPITNAATQEPPQSTEELAAQSREDSLLRRARGRLGTIATGLQGFLNESEQKQARKTLLGE